jgi:hypothetical protein
VDRTRLLAQPIRASDFSNIGDTEKPSAGGSDLTLSINKGDYSVAIVVGVDHKGDLHIVVMYRGQMMHCYPAVVETLRVTIHEGFKARSTRNSQECIRLYC